MALTREQWKDRLVKAGLPEEVIDNLMASVKDEDLVRMKDMSEEEATTYIAGVLALAKAACPECGAEVPEGAEKCPECGADLAKEEEEAEEKTPPPETKEDDDALAGIQALGDYLVERLKDSGLMEIQEVEFESPELDGLKVEVMALKEVVDGISTAFKDLQATLKDLLESDTQRLKDISGNLSDAQRTRLMQATLPSKDVMARVVQALQERKDDLAEVDVVDQGGGVLRDSNGNFYGSWEDWMQGKEPIKAA